MGFLDIFKRNVNSNSGSINKSNLEWKLESPMIFLDYTHSVVNAVSGVKMPMSLQFTASGTFLFEIENRDVYEKNSEEVIKSFISQKCATFLAQIVAKGNIDSDKSLKEQINELDLLEFVDIYDGDIGIKVTEITLKSFELTDDSFEKINEYNRIKSIHNINN